MKLVTPKEIQEAEKKAFTKKSSRLKAIEQAGLIVAQEAWINGDLENKFKALAIIGTGNNGSDGLVAARILSSWNIKMTIILLKKRSDLKVFLKNQIDNIECFIPEDKSSFVEMNKLISMHECVIDGLFGIGWDINRKKTDLNKIANQIIEQINNNQNYIISIDIPSGIDSENGQRQRKAIKADLTITFGAMKIGMTQQPASSLTGKIIIEDMQIAKYLNKANYAETIEIDKTAVKKIIRNGDENKGNFGKLLVIAGSRIYPGAAIMTCEAASIAGTGIISLLSNKFVQQTAIIKKPEIVLIDVGQNTEIDEKYFTKILKELNNFDAIVIGPGLSQSKKTVNFISNIITYLKKLDNSPPIVIDADGLNILSKMTKWPFTLSNKFILTPHPGEMSRIMQIPTKKVQGNRVNCAIQLSKQSEATIVLKGPGTIIASSNILKISNYSLPALASPGTGDILTGLIGGLLTQGLDPIEAVSLAVHFHALAGKELEKDIGSISAKASDLFIYLPKIIKQSTKQV
ncbi:MAG: NAD(P)H-hydrate dehydratase [Dehalococcoidia bacterium]|nr:NAD(P)H-hydrate dehydratase [Dehalococcoidia bacterium]